MAGETRGSEKSSRGCVRFPLPQKEMLQHTLFESRKHSVVFHWKLGRGLAWEGAQRAPGSFTKQFMDGSVKCGCLVTMIKF